MGERSGGRAGGQSRQFGDEERGVEKRGWGKRGSSLWKGKPAVASISGSEVRKGRLIRDKEGGENLGEDTR